MAFKAPSRKIIGLLIIAGAVVVSLGLLAKRGSPGTLADSEGVKVSPTQAIINKIDEIDSDNDSLKDWEEALWRTDTHNPDTDGDKTNDGEEVESGRNPYISGPNDKMSPEELPGATATSSTKANTDPLNPTQLAARELLAEYMTAKRSNRSLDSTTKENILGNVLLNAQMATVYGKSYIKSDIVAANSETKDTITAYGVSLRAILRPVVGTIPPDLQIISEALQSDDEQKMAKLGAQIDIYTTIIEGLTSISVPPSAVSLHLRLLNGYGDLTTSLQAVKGVYTDPLSAGAGMKFYFDANNEIYSALTNLNSYFSQQGIAFTTQ